jgi:hypothetical protein
VRAKSKRPTRGTPTEYAGVTFRSYLESQWANRFDWLGVVWEYEPVRVRLRTTGDHYTPDFSLPAFRAYLEVKPREPYEVEFDRAAEAAGVLGGGIYFLCGSPRHPSYWGARNTGEGWYFVPMTADLLPFPIEPRQRGQRACEFVCTKQETDMATETTSWTAPVPTGSGGGGGYEKAPPGNHPARLVAIIDMGTQWQNGFNGEPGKHAHKAYFVWELVTKKMSGSNRNHAVAIDLTWSMHEKAKMRLWIGARRGKPLTDDEARGFNVTAELGQPCLLNVIEKNGYPKVEGISGVPEGFTVPDAQNKPFAWRLEAAQGGKIDLPTWLPYFYGQPVGEAIKGAQEFEGKAVEVVNGPSNAAASGGVASQAAVQAAASAQGGSPPPPPPRRNSTPEPQFFLDAGDVSGIDHTVLRPVSAIRVLVAEKPNLDWHNATVSKPGGDWEPLTVAVPAAKDWLPIPY